MAEQDKSRKLRVVVIGGGYSGTMAANRLAGVSGIEVVLINERAWFVERIRLHQWAAGSGDAAREFSTVLQSGVQLVVGTAELIDASSHEVRLASGVRINYDYLVYALGSGAPNNPFAGAGEHGFRLDDWESADRLRGRLASAGQTVTVVGAGLTGIEAAAEFAERGHLVTLLSDGEIAQSLSDRGRDATRSALGNLGVEIRENVRVEEITAESVRIADGTEVPSAVTVITSGFSYPDLARRSGLACDSHGRLLTDGRLISIADPSIVGAGDAIAVERISLRNSCQAAIPLGAQAAAAIRALVAGDEPKVVDQGFVA